MIDETELTIIITHMRDSLADMARALDQAEARLFARQVARATPADDGDVFGWRPIVIPLPLPLTSIPGWDGRRRDDAIPSDTEGDLK